jgi:hypothetical protein
VYATQVVLLTSSEPKADPVDEGFDRAWHCAVLPARILAAISACC